MYEHPIKRFGLSMNRIIYSNTRMVANGFPRANPQKLEITYKYRTFAGGKATSSKSKRNDILGNHWYSP